MNVHIKVGDMRFVARLESKAAPHTCDAFMSLLPLQTQLIQARWSGEAAWIPLGDLKLGLKFKFLDDYQHGDPVALAVRGFVKLPTADKDKGLGTGKASWGGDLMLSGSKSGRPWQAGIRDPRGPRDVYFATAPVTDHAFSTAGNERLQELGEVVLWRGAQEISFTAS